MSTPEERFAELLHSQDILPRPHGLATIQRRVTARRRRRLVFLPSTALVAAGAVTAFVILSGSAGDASLNQVPGFDPSPVGIVTPSPTSPPTEDVDFYTKAIWPFTSQAQADAWTADPSAIPWAGSKVAVAQHFLTDFLKLTGVQVDPQCPACFEQSLQPLGTPSHSGPFLGDLALIGNGSKGTAPYSIANTTLNQGSAITQPKPNDEVTSPMQVAGSLNPAGDGAHGTPTTVDLQLIASDGTTLSSASVKVVGGTWSAPLSWTDTSWTTAAVVAITRDTDGQVTRILASPVTRLPAGAPSPTPSPGPSFAGIRDGRVNLYDSVSGRQVGQLTDPPTGYADTAASYSAGSLLFVRAKRDSCNDALDMLVGGRTSVVEAPGDHRLGTPKLSTDGRWGAWTQTTCDRTSEDLQVQEAGKPSRRLDVPVGTTVIDLDEVGTVLLHTGTDVTAVLAGATTLPSGDAARSAGLITSAEPGCVMSDAVQVMTLQDAGAQHRPFPTDQKVSVFGFEDCGITVGLINNDNGTHPNGRRVPGAQVLSWSILYGYLVTYRKVEGGPAQVAQYYTEGNGPTGHESFGPSIISDGSVTSASW